MAQRLKPSKGKFTVEQVAEAIRKSMGIYTGAGQLLGCKGDTIANYVNNYEELRDVLRNVLETRLDIAETVLLKHLRRESLDAAKFYLRTKGKDRGYSERNEVTGANGAPLIAPLDMANLTDEQLDRLSRGESVSVPRAADPGSAVATDSAAGAGGAGEEKAPPEE